MLSSEALNFDIAWVELSHSFVVELQPLLVALFDVTEIMAEISSTVVHNDASQFIRKLFIEFGEAFLFSQSVVVDIELLRELPSRIYFLVLEPVIVKAHSLQMDYEVIGGFLQETSFRHIALVFAAIALIVRDHLALDILTQGLLNILESFYFQ